MNLNISATSNNSFMIRYSGKARSGYWFLKKGMGGDWTLTEHNREVKMWVGSAGTIDGEVEWLVILPKALAWIADIR